MMNPLLRNFLSAAPPGTRLLVLVYALGFPLALLGRYVHAFDLYAWLGLTPALVWKGHVWRMFSYGFLAAGPVDWAVSLFWLVTLVAVLGRNWSALEFWGYCLLGIFAGAVPIMFWKPAAESVLAGNAAMTFALLVAWDWFYGRERLILLGLGEISVRQAAILIAIIDSIILFFWCGGWFLMPAMWCGGIAGGLYLFVRWKLVMGKSGQQVRSERAARLEL